MASSYDPAQEGAQMTFDGRMSYGDYLQLSRILSAQQPRSTAHDEMLFIIQHQTAELWMKLIVHEINAARNALQIQDLQLAFKVLTRVARIFEQINNSWDVLRTMTPSEYSQFRTALGQSSGFQSYQYRMIEYMLGNRNQAMLRPHAHQPDILQALEAELANPSLYDIALRLVHEGGITIPDDILQRDLSLPHQADARVRAAWAVIYRDPNRYWNLYQMAEKLVDFEDYFRRWRFNHVTTVERVIGFKRGTGGTGGVSYLKRMLDVELFPDIWHVRTEL
ncbi:tryptophan 2,3-dioxygenase [Thiolinea disciformis]|uniref:tryptophan 2,3-dioxygenase n=1 Tax=Thiolinea disciformis TaxID=125614 RepID=UPI000365A1EB|nr:tryptophan 2,3-dioxygenase [Thiolinea disciformis]